MKLESFIEKYRLIILFLLSIITGISAVIFYRAFSLSDITDENIRLLSEEEIKKIHNINQETLNKNKIIVDIEGQVNNPGVKEVPRGVSLLEVIDEAGGFTQEADMYYIHKSLNLAEEVKDRQKVYIPSINERNGESTTNNLLININTASRSELTQLPSVGDATAENIINARPFSSIEDIKRVKGIGDSTFEKIKKFITI